MSTRPWSPKLGRTYEVRDPASPIHQWLTMVAVRRTPAYSQPAPSEPGTLFHAVNDDTNRVIIPRNFYLTSIREPNT